MSSNVLTLQPKPGFKSSETSGVRVVIYRQNKEAIIAPLNLDQGGAYVFDGVNNQSPRPGLVSLSLQKRIGQAWSFSFVVKPPPGNPDLFQECFDDDWVDIHLTRWGYTWHTVRGLIDEVRRRRSVNASGATVTTWAFTGRCYQKIYEDTPIWFNRYNGENADYAAAYQVVQAQNMGGNVAQTVQLFLQGFFAQQKELGRVSYPFPAGMPNVGDNFLDSINFLPFYTNDPERYSVSTTLMMPEGPVWDLAQSWSDPMFCELYTDLVDANFAQNISSEIQSNQDVNQSDYNQFVQPSQFGDSTPSNGSQTAMAVILRDKPFPLVDPQLESTKTGIGLNSQWFKLPLLTVPRQYVTIDDLGRSGYERVNAYFVSCQLIQDFIKGDLVQIIQPMWSTNDMETHGMRRLDVVTRYVATDRSLVTMSEFQRLMARDWYCMNPYFLNGTISFGVGIPDLHIGTRLRIPGDTSSDDDETFYVEGVVHTWAFGPGLKTQAMVTRGWKGTDSSLISTLQNLIQNYASPVAQAAADTGEATA